MNNLRVGIVGAGYMGGMRARALVEIEGTSLVGVVDVDPDRCRYLAGSPEMAYRDVGRLLQDQKPDALIVSTSDGAHLEATVTALEAGAHVLVEKPLATTLEDCDAMIAAAQDAARTLMVGQTLRFDPRYATAAERLRGGEIGPPVHAFCRRNNTLRTPRRVGRSSSVLLFLGVHDFDWLLWAIVDRPVSVFATAVRKKLTRLAVDDAVFTNITFAEGCVAVIENSWALPENLPLALEAEVRLVGTKGVIYVDGSPQAVMMHSEQATHLDYVYRGAVQGHPTGPIMDETRHFIRCVRGGESPPADGPAGRAAVQLALAAQRSIDQGRVVRL